MKAYWLEGIEFVFLILLAVWDIILWDCPRYQNMNSIPAQAGLIFFSAVICTGGPITAAMLRRSHRGASWSIWNFALPFLFIVFPPLFFVFFIDSTDLSDQAPAQIKTKFVSLFYPAYGSLLIVMTMVYMLLIGEIASMHRLCVDTVTKRLSLAIPFCISIILIGILAFALPYVTDISGSLREENKWRLCCGGYFISTIFSAFGLHLLIWLEQG